MYKPSQIKHTMLYECNDDDDNDYTEHHNFTRT